MCQISRLKKICPAPRQDDVVFEDRTHLSQGIDDSFCSQNKQKFDQCVRDLSCYNAKGTSKRANPPYRPYIKGNPS